jgi:hypothetical protein
MMQSQYVMTEIARQRQDAFVREAQHRRHRSRAATPASTSGDTAVARRSWFVWRRFAQAAR